jgi:hypothetical protein
MRILRPGPIELPTRLIHVEHVVAKQHGGSDGLDNLCLSCHWCNLFKGPNLSSLVEGKLTRLFNPRTDAWSDHFAAIGGRIEGLTEIGVATVSLLNKNDPEHRYGDAARCFGRTDERPRRGFKASNFDHGS